MQESNRGSKSVVSKSTTKRDLTFKSVAEQPLKLQKSKTVPRKATLQNVSSGVRSSSKGGKSTNKTKYAIEKESLSDEENYNDAKFAMQKGSRSKTEHHGRRKIQKS